MPGDAPLAERTRLLGEFQVRFRELEESLRRDLEHELEGTDDSCSDDECDVEDELEGMKR